MKSTLNIRSMNSLLSMFILCNEWSESLRTQLRTIDTTTGHCDYSDFGAKETVDVSDKTAVEVAEAFEGLVNKGKEMPRSAESDPVVWESVAEL